MSDELYEPLYRRVLPDGRVIHLNPMLFGKVRLCVSASVETENYTYDHGY